MDNSYICRICRSQILSASPHTATEHAQISCARCVDNPIAHETLYPDCSVKNHLVLDHPVMVGTALGVHRYLMRLAKAAMTG
jgi:hypothetical protein